MNKIFAFLTIMLLALFANTNVAYGQYYGQTQDKYELVVDKTVRPISEDVYYDNLNKDRFFSESEQVEFRIVVANKGNKDLDNLKFVDTLPKYLEMLFYPGEFKSGSSTIESTIEKLGVGETKIYLIRGKVGNSPEAEYPTYYQQINKACVSNQQASDCDNARYYITSRTTPVTGSESLVWQSGLVGAIGYLAMRVRKYVRGY